MAFQKYQGEQVQQIPQGYAEAMGAMGKAYMQTGASIAGGIQEAAKRNLEEAKLQGTLAPYLENTKSNIEQSIKLGNLKRDPDGKVVPADGMNAGDVDTFSINFYNKTGGDVSKLSGPDLQQFAASFDAKKQIESQARTNAAASVDLDLKRAQTAKLLAEAAEKGGDTNFYSKVAGFMGGSGYPSPSSVVTGTPYLPTTPGSVQQQPGSSPPPSTDFSAYVAGQPLNPSEKLSVSDTLSAGASFVTKNPAMDESAKAWYDKLYRGSTVSGGNFSEPKSSDTTVRATVSRGNFSEPDISQVPPASTDEMAASAALESSKFTSPLTAGTAPKSAANPTTPTPANPTAAQVAGTISPKTDLNAKIESLSSGPTIQELAAKSTEDLRKLGEKRQSLYVEKAKAMDTVEKQIAFYRTQFPANEVRNPQRELAYANLTGYWDKQREIQSKQWDDKIAEVTAQEAQIKSTFEISQKQAADLKTQQELKNAEAAGVRADTKMKQETTKFDQEQIAAYPQVGVFVHAGNRIAMKGDNPASFGIQPLNPTAQSEVNMNNEGWIKSTNFIVNLDKTLDSRQAMGENSFKERFRLLTNNLEGWASGELASIFGVATFRRAIVSGGNFSDADREFVQRTITYINSLDPTKDYETMKAQNKALAKFVDGMYRDGMRGYNLRYDPNALKTQGEALKAKGYDDEGNAYISQANDADKFNSRFGIKSDFKPGSADFKSEIDASRKVMWDALTAAGKTKGIENSRKGGLGTY